MSNATPATLTVAIAKVFETMDKLTSDERLRLIETISTFYKDDLNTSNLDAYVPRPRTIVEDRMPVPSASVPYSSTGEAPSPKEFIFQKDPQTDVERVACLAYYLLHYRNIQHFKTLDLSKLNTEAAQPKFTNTSFTAKNAVDGRYLTSASKGHRQLSAMGERFVDALPDRDTAKDVMNSKTSSRRRKKSNSRNRGKSQKSAKTTVQAA